MKLNINDHVYYALNGICEVKDYILNILKED